MSHPIRGRAAILVFLMGPKNYPTNLIEDVEILLSVKLFLIPFSGFRGEVENISTNQRPGGHLGFPIGQKRLDLASCQLRSNSVQRFRTRSRKCPSQSEFGRPSCFFFGPTNINLVKDVEILLPVKFRWILFSSFRGEVENVIVNQRPGGHLGFPIGPKNTNLVDDI